MSLTGNEANNVVNTQSGSIEGNMANAPPPTHKSYNVGEGGALKKGGQKFHELMKDSILISYANLTNSPTLLMVYTAIWIITLAEGLGMDKGPLEYWHDYLAKGSSKYVLGEWIRRFQLWLINICVANKFYVITLANFSLPWFYKPSNKNFYFLLVMTLCSTFLFNASVVEIFVMGQLWFLFTQIRDPGQKYIIVIIAMLIFVLPTTGLLEYFSGTDDPGKLPDSPVTVKPSTRTFHSHTTSIPPAATTKKS